MGKSSIREDEFLRNCRNYANDLINKRTKIPDFKEHYELIKELFYDYHQYKWRISKGVDYIINQRLDARDFTEYLKDFREEYILKSGNTVKLIGLQKFIQTMENNQKINSRRLGKRNFISLKSNADFNDFITDVYDLVGHLDTKHSVVIEMIYNNISIPYSKSTFERKYYDGLKKYKND